MGESVVNVSYIVDFLICDKSVDDILVVNEDVKLIDNLVSSR